MLTCECGFMTSAKGMHNHKRKCDGSSMKLKQLLSCVCGYNTTFKASMNKHLLSCKKINYNPNVNYVQVKDESDIEQQEKHRFNMNILLNEKKTSDRYISQKLKGIFLLEINQSTKIINKWKSGVI